MLNDFAGNTRFEVLRCLGEGGMGVVYEAIDRERNAHVAVKTLRHVSGEALLRFKAEFRNCQHLQHPNLISLGDLYEEAGGWFFSMELVEGVDFVKYVRGSEGTSGIRPLATAERQFAADGPTLEAPFIDGGQTSEASAAPPLTPQSAGTFDEARLRSALLQLARGLGALHQAARVHRDIKPSNVLVDGKGRVVVLDFGLAIDMSRRSMQLTNRGIIGTPLYMAPEQAAALPVGPPADWYAVGALLYEALTGSAPFEGSDVYQLLVAKQHKSPRAPRELVPSVPADLDQLCLALLAIKPEDRPGGDEVLARLGHVERAPTSASSAASSSPSVASQTASYDFKDLPFVGRDNELQELTRISLDVTTERHARVVYILGESGIGKSTLVDRFLKAQKEALPSLVVLSGRCYEHEDVPFKAVDGIVDDLSRYMARLPKGAATALVPRNAALLRRAFPVLGRVEAFAECPPSPKNLDPLELRSRVFGALRELLGRLSDRAMPVLVVDDLQWADADSTALISELVRGPDSPAFLLIGTVRTDPKLVGLALPSGTNIQLERLTDAESRSLASDLLERIGRNRSLDLDDVVREAGGHPLFLEELARSAPESSVPQIHALDSVLWGRVGELDAATKELLEIVAVATSPIPQMLAARAANLSGDAASRHIKRLKVSRLVTTTGGTRATDLIEPYHDRVRQAVLTHLAPAVRVECHRRIAVALETSGDGDPEALTIHWREAGDTEKAAHYAEAAGDRAIETFAFEQAARHYRLALELVRPEHAHAVRVKLGDALVNSGSSAAGGRVFSEAAKTATATEGITLRRKAAEHLLRSGNIDAGLEELNRVLAAVGIKIPTSPEHALASFLFGRVRMKVRGLKFKPKAENDVPIERLVRLDVCWAAAIGLALVDTIRGLDFQVRHLQLALEVGEPKRVTRALALEALSGASLGGAARVRGKDGGGGAEAVARTLDHPYSTTFVKAVSGAMAYMEGSWREAYERSNAAAEEFRSHSSGVAWELASGRQICLWSLCYLGRLTDLAEAVRIGLRECLDAGDLYASVAVRSGFPNCIWLVKDDPKGAREDADRAIEKWSRKGIHLQHLIDLFGQTQIDLYEGDFAGAWARVERSLPALQRSVLPKVQLNRILIADLQGRAALAAASKSPDRRLIDKAKRAIKDLAAEEVPWATGMSQMLEAQMFHLTDRSTQALEQLDRATRTFEGADMALHVATCRFFRRHLDPKTPSSVRDEAEAFFRRERVVRPDRFAAVIAPGFER